MYKMLISQVASLYTFYVAISKRDQLLQFQMMFLVLKRLYMIFYIARSFRYGVIICFTVILKHRGDVIQDTVECRLPLVSYNTRWSFEESVRHGNSSYYYKLKMVSKLCTHSQVFMKKGNFTISTFLAISKSVVQYRSSNLPHSVSLGYDQLIFLLFNLAIPNWFKIKRFCVLKSCL